MRRNGENASDSSRDMFNIHLTAAAYIDSGRSDLNIQSLQSYLLQQRQSTHKKKSCHRETLIQSHFVSQCQIQICGDRYIFGTQAIKSLPCGGTIDDADFDSFCGFRLAKGHKKATTAAVIIISHCAMSVGVRFCKLIAWFCVV